MAAEETRVSRFEDTRNPTPGNCDSVNTSIAGSDQFYLEVIIELRWPSPLFGL